MIKNHSYQNILIENKKLGENFPRGSEYRINILSNMMVPQIKELLEYCLRLQGINAVVEFGNYDNIVQDSRHLSKAHAMIIFWEAANLINGLQYKAETMKKGEIESLLEKVKREIEYVFSNLAATPLVVFNKFSSLVFNHSFLRSNNFDYIVNELNSFLEPKVPSGGVLVDIDKVIASISIEKSVDWRFYYSSKMLYTIEYYKQYVDYVKPLFMAVNGKAKKVLIFDCDNTLWEGVVGEDGKDGIKMDDETPEGTVFEEVQSLGLSLAQKGVMLGICSKNNPADVDEILGGEGMTIKDDDLTIKKVNWSDKYQNLASVADELNVGEDSLVFIDESDFEVGLIREKMPMVTTVQVPKSLYAYPVLFRKYMDLFFNFSISIEDQKRGRMYKQNKARQKMKVSFLNLDDYLRALELRVCLHENDQSSAARVAQLTQKTNQFNLTTKRYTEADIKRMMASNDHKIIAFSVFDKFGDNGMVGVFIIKHIGGIADIDTFLMSCRIIGRNIEYVVFDRLVDRLKQLGMLQIRSWYKKTTKNGQVSNFFSNLGFKVVSENKDATEYVLPISGYKGSNVDYIKVEHVSKNESKQFKVK